VGENRLLVEYGRLIAEGSQVTQELADHQAFMEGLIWLLRQEDHRRRIIAHTDSIQVYNHLARGQPVDNSTLQPTVDEMRMTLGRFPQLELKLISTQENRNAVERAAAIYVKVQEQRRRQRAAEVVGELYQARPGHFWVGNRYRVNLEAGTCTCPDFRQMHTDRYPIRCKHLLAALEIRRQSKE
jgi:predicted nucleic acid-binding Zn finger protein